MAAMKVAITLPEDIFNKTEQRAREQGVPRSQVIAKALEEQYRREEARRLLQQINAAHADGLTEEDRAFLGAAERQTADRLRRQEEEVGAEPW